MKSKRAKEFLIQYGVPPSPTAAFNTLPATTGAALVELAEEDARERAVKAMCKATEGSGYRCDDVCPRIHDRYCSYVRDFIEAYDNEN